MSISSEFIQEQARYAYWSGDDEKRDWAIRLMQRCLGLTNAQRYMVLIGDAYFEDDGKKNTLIEAVDAEWKNELVHILENQEAEQRDHEKKIIHLGRFEVDRTLWEGYIRLVRIYRDFLRAQNLDPSFKFLLMQQRGLELNMAIEYTRNAVHDLILCHMGVYKEDPVYVEVTTTKEYSNTYLGSKKRSVVSRRKEVDFVKYIPDKEHPDYWEAYNVIQEQLDKEVSTEFGIVAYRDLAADTVRSTFIRVLRQLADKYMLWYEDETPYTVKEFLTYD